MATAAKPNTQQATEQPSDAGIKSSAPRVAPSIDARDRKAAEHTSGANVRSADGKGARSASDSGRSPADPDLERKTDEKHQRGDSPNPLVGRVKRLFRMTPASLAVLTTTSSKSQYYGLTLASLTCLSLAPNPVVTFNIKLPSRTYSAIPRGAKRSFLLHLISANTAGASLASNFSQGLGSEAFQNTSLQIEKTKSGFPLVDWQCRSNAMDSGVEAVLVCRMLESQMEIQDHVIVVAQVVNLFLPVYDRVERGQQEQANRLNATVEPSPDPQRTEHAGNKTPTAANTSRTDASKRPRRWYPFGARLPEQVTGFLPNHGLTYCNRRWRDIGKEISPEKAATASRLRETSASTGDTSGEAENEKPPTAPIHDENIE